MILNNEGCIPFLVKNFGPNWNCRFFDPIISICRKSDIYIIIIYNINNKINITILINPCHMAIIADQQVTLYLYKQTEIAQRSNL